MLIAGANGHAKDMLNSLDKDNFKELIFFDDVTTPPPNFFLERYKIINLLEDAKEYLKKYKNFVIAIGGTMRRKKLSDKLESIGGIPWTYKANNSVVGTVDVLLGKGLNIMPFVLISNSVQVGDGTLLNIRSSLHHDVTVGKYCNIAPGATLLGGVEVGDFTMLGANVTVLPNIRIGNHCRIGAGSVITKSIPDNSKVMGVPGKVIKTI